MPIKRIVSPITKVTLPQTSIFRARLGSGVSLSFRYAHTVPRMPTGTLTRNTYRQL